MPWGYFLVTDFYGGRTGGSCFATALGDPTGKGEIRWAQGEFSRCYQHLQLEVGPPEWMNIYASVNVITLSLTYCLYLTTQIWTGVSWRWKTENGQQTDLLAWEIITVWILLLQTSVFLYSWQEFWVHHWQLFTPKSSLSAMKSSWCLEPSS